MAQIHFDEVALEALRKAPFDSNEAAKVLLIFADYIRKEKPIPRFLIDYVAGSIEASMQKNAEYRNKALLRELNLRSWNEKPPKADFLDIGIKIDAHIKVDGFSQNRAADTVCKSFNKKSQKTISRSTAIRYYKKYLKWVERSDQIKREELNRL